MPSHIFLAVGMWDDVIDSNIDSWEASVERKNEKNLDNDALSYHALQWLLYGHLQSGHFEEARSILLDMHSYTTELPSKTARGYLISMQGAFVVETDEWTLANIHPGISLEELSVLALAKQVFTAGMQAYNDEDLDSLSRLIQILEVERNNSVLLINDKGLPMCSSGGNSTYSITQRDIEQATVIEYELRALNSILAGDSVSVVKEWFNKATELESQLSFGFGPPNILKPSHELYAEYLLESGNAREARTYFEEALFRAPNRRLSNIGIVKCDEIDKDLEI
jgi:hypothetical protein